MTTKVTTYGYFRLELGCGRYVIAVSQKPGLKYLSLDLVVSASQVIPFAMVCHPDLPVTTDEEELTKGSFISLSPNKQPIVIGHQSEIADNLRRWALLLRSFSLLSLYNGPHSLSRPPCSIRGVVSSKTLTTPRSKTTNHEVTEVGA